MFSNDIYSYAAQGEMVSHHISPYLYGPEVLGASPFTSLAQGVWINTPSPYGPLFSGLEGGVVNLTGHRVLISIILLRLLAVVGVALIAGFLPSLAESYGKDPSQALALALLNPLVLLFLVGSGHNDALMIGLLVAGLSIARRGRCGWGMVICALAGAVKVPGAVGAFAIAWTSTGIPSSLWQRSISLAKAVVIVATTFALLSAVFGVGWGWTRSLGQSASVTNWITPVDLIAKVTTHVGLSTSAFLNVAHVVGPAVAVLLGLWVLRHLNDLGLPRALGFVMLAFVLLGPIVQPWYLLWGIVILAVTAGTRTAYMIGLLSVTVCILGAVGLGQLVSELESLPLPYETLLGLTVAASVVMPISGSPPRTTSSFVSPRTGPWRLFDRWQISQTRHLQRV